MIDLFIERMTVLGRGLVFRQAATAATTENAPGTSKCGKETKQTNKQTNDNNNMQQQQLLEANDQAQQNKMQTI